MDTTQHLRAGTLLNGIYRIERVLGQGGFGITYLAVDTSLDRKVAIKEFFPQDYCRRNGDTSHVTLGTQSSREFIDQLRAKFLKEALNIAKLDYPSIIRIIAQFEANGTAYYVMDYIEGESLNDIIAQRGPMNEQIALANTEWIGKALEYIHAKRINHLDVKPSNVMVRRTDNLPILIDFGLSKQYDRAGQQTSHTPTGISYGYAPIEQYDRAGLKEFSPETDIYSLAATLYYMMTGTTPPPATALIEGGMTFPDSIPLHLRHVIAKAMASNRAYRYHSVGEFLYALKHARETDPGATQINFGGGGGGNFGNTVGQNMTPPGGANFGNTGNFPPPGRKKGNKGWLKWTAIVAGVVSLFVALVFILGSIETQEEKVQAQMFPGEEPIEVPVYTNPDPVYLGEEFECDNSDGTTIKYKITSSRTVEVAKGSYTGTVNIPPEVHQGNNRYYVTAIGEKAFYIATVTAVTIPLTVTSIGNQAFYLSSLERIKIPNSVTHIGDNAFESCHGMTLVVMGNNVKTLGHKAFAYCDELRQVFLSPSLETIGNGSFMFCKQLKYAANGCSLQVVGDSAFYACKELRSMRFAPSTKYIGNESFHSCDAMTQIVIPRTVQSVGERAFAYSTGIQTAYLSAKPQYGRETTYCCTGLTEICTTMTLGREEMLEKFCIPGYRSEAFRIQQVAPSSIIAAILNL